MTTPGSVEWFDRIASRYDRSLGQLTCRRADADVLALAADLSPGTVLDIGCGTGRLLAEVARTWPHAMLAGVDPAPSMVAVAKTRLPDAQLTVACAERLPLGDHTIDLVVSTTSFGHWQDQARGLAEVRRVLRPGGRLVLADHRPLPRWAASLSRVFGDLPAHRTQAELVALINGACLTPLLVRRTTRGGLLVVVATTP